jgi:hypothetical protein
MKYQLMQSDVEPFNQFYYVVDSQNPNTFIKATDLECNEISLPAAFSIVDLNPEQPTCSIE